MTIHWLDEVDSTNRVASEGDFRHGDVVASLNQTAGRGRLDRSWSMEPGAGVAMSIVVSQSELGSPAFLTRLPLVVGASLVQSIAAINPAATAPTVKWPNDVLFTGRKVAGILVEQIDADRLAVGVGVNLTDVPAHLDTDAVTSLRTEGFDVSPTALVESFVVDLLDSINRLDDRELLRELSAIIDTIGREVTVELPNGTIVAGRATGLGESGSLLVQTDRGVREFVAGDVTHVRLGGDVPVR